ncbi:MAG: cytidine deaminase [Anaerolineales bacterium]
MKINAEQRTELIERGQRARENAYAPYSHYPVGAALLTRSGEIYQGANIENAAYPLSICAERVAIFKAVANGDREPVAISVITENGGSPCGACRQVMAEFGLETWVILADKDGNVVHEMTVEELLPAAFRPSDLA